MFQCHSSLTFVNTINHVPKNQPDNNRVIHQTIREEKRTTRFSRYPSRPTCCMISHGLRRRKRQPQPGQDRTKSGRGDDIMFRIFSLLSSAVPPSVPNEEIFLCLYVCVHAHTRNAKAINNKIVRRWKGTKREARRKRKNFIKTHSQTPSRKWIVQILAHTNTSPRRDRTGWECVNENSTIIVKTGYFCRRSDKMFFLVRSLSFSPGCFLCDEGGEFPYGIID